MIHDFSWIFLETVQRVHLHVIQSLTQRELMTSQTAIAIIAHDAKNKNKEIYIYILLFFK